MYYLRLTQVLVLLNITCFWKSIFLYTLQTRFWNIFRKFIIIYRFHFPVILSLAIKNTVFDFTCTNQDKVNTEKVAGDRLHPVLIYEVIKRPHKMSKIPILLIKWENAYMSTVKHDANMETTSNCDILYCGVVKYRLCISNQLWQKFDCSVFVCFADQILRNFAISIIFYCFPLTIF